jgi:hypothetical protein
MKLRRPLLVLACFLLFLATAALWWNSPSKVDMADYAPADALLYIEVNSIGEITRAIQQGEIFQAISPIVGVNSTTESKWALLAARAGIAPTQAVISSRAQMALVMLGINTAAGEDSLRVKPEIALIIETHTAKWRMKSTAVNSIKQLAQFAYGTAACTERTGNAEYVECLEPKGSRKIIAAIDGSVVIIGNSDKAVESCLQVRHAQRPSLHTDADFVRSRADLKGDLALAFGYVSQPNAAKLVSFGAPLLFGKAPGDRKFEGLVADSSAKILRGLAWTTKSNAAGIEDRYQISLEPEVVKRLEPAFEIGSDNPDFWKLVPASFRSITVYRSKDPEAAWFSLDSALSLKLDAVSTVIVASLLKSGLSGYGIENPKAFLSSMTSPLLTLRAALGEESLLLGRVKDEEQLRQALSSDLLREGKGQILSGLQSEPNREKEFTAIFIDGFVVLGKTENILVYLAQLRNNEVLSIEHQKTLGLSERPRSATVTYSDERASVSMIVGALSRLSGRTLSQTELEAIQTRLANMNDSCTESSLNSDGIERRTQSAFGQFGNLLSLAVADSSNPVN